MNSTPVLIHLLVTISFSSKTETLPADNIQHPRHIVRRAAPVTTECGSSPVNSLTKIVGGEDAEKDDWPWMAALLEEDGTQFCGGTLINDQFVLSAAHCFPRVRNDPTKLIIGLGAHTIKTVDPNMVKYKVSAIISHPAYSRRTAKNDIGLIKLAEKVRLTPAIHAACLPSKNSPSFEGEQGFVTGWGYDVEGSGVTTDVLQVVALPIWRHEDCRKSLPSLDVANTQMCAAFRAGGKDSCQGDSGGPLVVNPDPDAGKWILAGIVSAGIGCARPDRPGLYTRVASYLDWINENMALASAQDSRIGCPNGYKTMDESVCINEFWLDQFQKGLLTWDQVLERRQNKDGLQPLRSTTSTCPKGHEEYDEFYCLSSFLARRYRTGQEKWNNLFTFAKNKNQLPPNNGPKVVTGPKITTAVPPPKFQPQGKRLQSGAIPCSQTVADNQGISLVKFDEFTCIAPEYLNGFKSGEFHWYDMFAQRFEKKL